jgi:hypothetical protein
MSDSSGATLAEADAIVRWFGLERHRLLLLTLAVGLGADALVRPGTRWWEGLAALVAVILTVPGAVGRSWGELAVMETRYRLRRRLWWISVVVDSETLTLNVRGDCRVWTYDFFHRGRLDLASRDVGLATRLVHMVDTLAAAGDDAHVSLHVDAGDDGSVRTVLSTTVASIAPPEWRRDPRVGVPRTLVLGRNPLIERRHYVRTSDHVVRTLRVIRFAPGRETAALAALSERVSWLTLSVHASVVPAPRARRLTARAVHRVGSDAHATQAAGFRWSARREWELDVLRQREQVVAAGAALCQWALYVVVRASSLPQLRRRVAEVTVVARTAGVRLDPGSARQREWYAFQLPGGPGW